MKKFIVLGLCISVIIGLFLLWPKNDLQDKRAVWFSYMDLETFSYQSKEAFIEDFSEALDVVKKNKLNTVIVQIRPYADALYSSDIFPLSQTITKQVRLSFDPLQEMVTLAHQNDLSFEAWINPYRIASHKKTYDSFVATSPKKEWLNDKTKTIQHGTYQYIFHPGSQDVQDYIVAGVEEIVKRYDVDGIHFDDYFYVPGTHGTTTKQERMDDVNQLIKRVYQAIKAIDEEVVFGVSPQGNYENCLDEGADIETWLKDVGYVDYVMPQIYWSDQYGENGTVKMFSQRAEQFAGFARHSQVNIYGGLALYRAGEKTAQDLGWSQSNQNISQQVKILDNLGYRGYSLFRYANLLSTAGSNEMSELLNNSFK